MCKGVSARYYNGLMPFSIVDYHPRYRDGVHHVACETAHFGKPMSTGFGQDRLLVATYAVDLYLSRHPDLTRVVVDEQDGVFGYITGTPDTSAYDAFNSRTFPQRVWKGVRTGNMNLGPEDLKLGLGFLGFLLLGPVIKPAEISEYPAHLHINLLAPTRGQGLGRRLINIYEDLLRQRGVKGLHLVTSSLNEGADAFYAATGFDLLRRFPVPAVPWLNPKAMDMLVYAKRL